MSIALPTLLWSRLITALTTVPSLTDWELTMGSLIIYAGLALLIGGPTHFLYWNPWVKHWLQITLQAFFAPALIEEIGFRVLLSPAASENVSPQSWWFWGGLSIVLFLLYHPLNALTFYKPGYPTFFNPIFLILATLLGIACTLVYWFTGSLWPPVMLHWIVVMTWLCGFGGFERLAQQEVSAIDD